MYRPLNVSKHKELLMPAPSSRLMQQLFAYTLEYTQRVNTIQCVVGRKTLKPYMNKKAVPTSNVD